MLPNIIWATRGFSVLLVEFHRFSLGLSLFSFFFVLSWLQIGRRLSHVIYRLVLWEKHRVNILNKRGPLYERVDNLPDGPAHRLCLTPRSYGRHTIYRDMPPGPMEQLITRVRPFQSLTALFFEAATPSILTR